MSDDGGRECKSVREKMDVRNIGKVRSLDLCVKVVLWCRVLPDVSLQVRKTVLLRTEQQVYSGVPEASAEGVGGVVGHLSFMRGTIMPQHVFPSNDRFINMYLLSILYVVVAVLGS